MEGVGAIIDVTATALGNNYNTTSDVHRISKVCVEGAGFNSVQSPTTDFGERLPLLTGCCLR